MGDFTEAQETATMNSCVYLGFEAIALKSIESVKVTAEATTPSMQNMQWYTVTPIFVIFFGLRNSKGIKPNPQRITLLSVYLF